MLHRIPPGHPVGGSGRLSEALAARFTSYGGTLRLGDGAARIHQRAGRITGVTTESGDGIAAGRVVAGCHVLTMLRLLGDPLLLGKTAPRVRVGNGIGMVVRLGTRDLPRYPAAPPEAHRALQLLCDSRQQLRRAHGEFSWGRPPTDPPALAMTFSAFDDTLAPPGRHNVTVWGQWHPYELANGESWDSIGAREGAKLVAAVDRAAPGFADSVEVMHVQTPLDLERELGLLRGNVMHVEMALDAMFAWRPLPEWSAYRGPADGLYLCGASTHPGGGVFGASGRAAADTLLRDRAAARRWWRRGG